MYNPKDIQFAGKHDYDKSEAEAWASNPLFNSFSVGVFQWEMKSRKKEMKQGVIKVRVSGPISNKEKVFAKAEEIVLKLDAGEVITKKSIRIK